MEKGWIKVFSTNDEYLGTITKELLEQNNIESVLANRKDSSCVFMGELELYVREANENHTADILEHLKNRLN